MSEVSCQSGCTAGGRGFGTNAHAPSIIDTSLPGLEGPKSSSFMAFDTCRPLPDQIDTNDGYWYHILPRLILPDLNEFIHQR
jgi:hypothetical protein